jgi:hypothetical protein
MEIVGLVLAILGGFLLNIWFETRRMMIRERAWAEQGGTVCYLWPVLCAGVIALGVKLMAS